MKISKNTSEARVRYVKKKAIEYFNKVNIDSNYRLTIPGDGKYQLIEDIIKHTVDITIKIYEDGKHKKDG